MLPQQHAEGTIHIRTRCIDRSKVATMLNAKCTNVHLSIDVENYYGFEIKAPRAWTR
jgi:hypothetical protein